MEAVVTTAAGAPRSTMPGTNERSVFATPNTFTLKV